MRNSATTKIICDILNLMFVWSVTMIRIIPALQLLERVADGDQNLDKDGCRSLEVVHQVSKAGVVAEPWKKRIYGFSCPSRQFGHTWTYLEKRWRFLSWLCAHSSASAASRGTALAFSGRISYPQTPRHCPGPWRSMVTYQVESYFG